MPKAIAAARDLFGAAPSLPQGFAYRENLFSDAEERECMRIFATLPLKPFEFHGYLGNRRVASYGYRYDYAGRALRDAEPIPDFLLPLRGIASRFGGVPEEALRQALVTEYAPGAGIGWHKDKPMFEKIVALSFGSPCVLRLRRPAGKSWERASAEVLPRSAYMLSGEVRDGWQHSIAPMDTLRYSVTFRSFYPG
jgi:alkylated DNA repair dioxygenase AlkB